MNPFNISKNNLSNVLGYVFSMSNFFEDKFGKGAVLQSSDGAKYDIIEEVDNNLSNDTKPIQSNIPSLAEQLRMNKEMEEMEQNELTKQNGLKRLDLDEIQFLNDIKEQELLEKELKMKQELNDINQFNKQIKNRIKKINDNDTNNDHNNTNPSKIKNNNSNLIVAPSINNESKMDFGSIKIKMKRKKKKRKKRDKTNKLNDDIIEPSKKKRKLIS